MYCKISGVTWHAYVTGHIKGETVWLDTRNIIVFGIDDKHFKNEHLM